jgi:hypothetical protein
VIQRIINKSAIFIFVLLLTNVSFSQNNTCIESLVFCSTSAISYAGGTNAGNGEPGPCYDCCASTPNPAWFFMQMQNTGNVTITITSSPPRDIDFVLWGPYSNPTVPCNGGLTCDKVEDCSYAGGTGPEYADITGGIVGEFYILILTNFSNDPTEITFSQTGGSGQLNCDIVFECSIVDFTAIPTACNPATNSYMVEGQIDFTNPPTSGTLNITDNTSGVSQSFNPPFVSPLLYSLPGIVCDNSVHQITASFSADPDCNRTESYTAPLSACPNASLKGGGSTCAGGNPVNVNITIVGGAPPYNFTYSIDGINQPEVQNYSGPFPYNINTLVAGTYSMVSVSSTACSGVASGTAEVIVNPLPSINLGADTAVCPGVSLTLDAGPGMELYTWSSGAASQSIVATEPNTYSVTIKDINGCENTDSIIISNNPVPTPVLIKHN